MAAEHYQHEKESAVITIMKERNSNYLKSTTYAPEDSQFGQNM
jgi:hypothetical protein